MRLPRLFGAAALALLVPLSSASAQGLDCAALGPRVFRGAFTLVHADGPACEGLFGSDPYRVEVRLTGADTPSVMLTFTSVPGATFDDLTFVGLIGANGDFGVRKEAVVGELKREMHFEGVFDPSLLWLKAKVDVSDIFGIPVCHASAELTARPML